VAVKQEVADQVPGAGLAVAAHEGTPRCHGSGLYHKLVDREVPSGVEEGPDRSVVVPLATDNGPDLPGSAWSTQAASMVQQLVGSVCVKVYFSEKMFSNTEMLFWLIIAFQILID
jgi:hypothetical protein